MERPVVDDIEPVAAVAAERAQVAEGQENSLGLATGDNHHITHKMGQAGTGIKSPVEIEGGG